MRRLSSKETHNGSKQPFLQFIFTVHNYVEHRRRHMSLVPAVGSKPPFLDFPGVKPGPSVRQHQSWKAIDSDPSSPFSVQRFLHCPSLPRPTPSSGSHRDLQRRQLTFLLLAFSRTSVTLLLAFWMSSKAGSLCLRKGRAEPHPLRCVFAHGC